MYLAKSFEEAIIKGNWTDKIESAIPDSPNHTDSLEMKDKYSKLKGVHLLQKSIVRQNMHNAMSPISAISGYLELINMSLSEDVDLDQIEYYRQKIESGIKEVNNIIEQLQVIYNDESDTTVNDADATIEVDLNWIVKDVINTMNFEVDRLDFNGFESPLHIQTDLFITKLILFNLISYAFRNSLKDEPVHLQNCRDEEEACFYIRFKVANHRRQELIEILDHHDPSAADDSFANGLMTSSELVEQINGSINFGMEEDAVYLRLAIPLSVTTNGHS